MIIHQESFLGYQDPDHHMESPTLHPNRKDHFHLNHGVHQHRSQNTCKHQHHLQRVRKQKPRQEMKHPNRKCLPSMCLPRRINQQRKPRSSHRWKKYAINLHSLDRTYHQIPSAGIDHLTATSKWCPSGQIWRENHSQTYSVMSCLKVTPKWPSHGLEISNS